MFASKSRTKAASNILLIAVVLFNTFAPTNISAKSQDEIKAATSKNNSTTDLLSSISLGVLDSSYQSAPILAEQIAKQAQQEQVENPIRLKVKVEPAIYTPGTPVTLSWELKNLKAADLPNAALVIHAPQGVSNADPNPIYTPDGLITVTLESKKDTTNWN